MSTTPATGQWLNRAEQAARLGVGEATIAQYVQRYGPDHANPYPVHIDGQHKTFGRSTAVLDTALDAWQARRDGPNLSRPAGLTAAQRRAVEQLAAGERPTAGVLVALVEQGLACWDPTAGWGLTSTGSQVAAER